MWVKIIITAILIISFLGSIAENDKESAKRLTQISIAAVLALAFVAVNL